MISRRHLTIGMAGVSVLASHARSEEKFPSYPLKVTVPYGAGTSTDIVTRRICASAQEILGKPIVVENRPGASGILGTQFVKRSEPDGYTLLIGNIQTHAINATYYKNLPYDPLADFKPVVGLVSQTHILVVRPALGVKSLSELVALAKSKPGSLTFASTGNGTTPHLIGEIFKREAKIDMLHVPYTGAQAITDLLSGTVSMMFYGYQALKPYLDAGDLIPLATTASVRPSWLPSVATMPEQGYPNAILDAWFGVYAPAKTADDRLIPIYEAFRASLSNTNLHVYLNSSGTSVDLRNGTEFRKFTSDELTRLRPIVIASGAQVD